MGDVLIANMKGFERMPDGSKGDQLPAVAGGDGVEILLEKGKFNKRENLTLIVILTLVNELLELWCVVFLYTDWF